VRIYLVGMPGDFHAEALILEQHPFGLCSHAHPGLIDCWPTVWEKIPSSAIIDSGAFTASTLGKSYSVAEYAGFIDGFDDAWGSSLHERIFMSLDVIGDQQASWSNFDELQRRGYDVLPILTRGCSAADIDRAAEHDYLAVGGCVGVGRSELQPYLDRIFARLMKRDRLPRVHLLGLTQDWAARRYPAFSADSTSWLKVVFFGQSRLTGIDSAVKYCRGGAERAYALEGLRAEVRHYQKMQATATELWARRGIEWPEWKPE